MDYKNDVAIATYIESRKLNVTKRWELRQSYTGSNMIESLDSLVHAC